MKFLFKKSITTTANDTSPSPYLNARRTWNHHVGGVLSALRTWQIVGILGLMMGLAGVGGIIHIGNQSKFVPYVVQVDKLGQAVAVAPAQKARPVDARVIHATIASFIADARLVTPDVALQRKAIFRLYAMLGGQDPALTKMNQWLNGNADANPFKRAVNEMVSTEIISAIPQTEETWQIDWVETIRDRQGVSKENYRMRALVTIYVVPPNPYTTEEEIRKNPLGIYIRDFSWSRQV